jgi:hypothetical protein
VKKDKSKIAFWVFFCAIIIVGLFLRLNIIRNNNLFFTVDQGRDAIFAREILHGHLFLKGPETNIRGIFAGPLSDYLFAIGYLVSGGHPVGAVLTLIAINLAATSVLILWLKKYIGPLKALIVGGALQIFWPFFETTLWGFHPFPLVALAIVLLILLTEFLAGKKNYYFLGLIPIFLAFNSEVAGTISFFIFYLIVGIYGVKKKFISQRKFLLLDILLPLSGAIFFGREFIIQSFLNRSGGTLATSGKSAGVVFSGLNISNMASEFMKIIGSVILPQQFIIGFVLFLVIIFVFVGWLQGQTMQPPRMFVILSFVLTLTSFVFFSSNQGWRSWHTVYLPPLLFVSALLLLMSLPKKFGYIVLAVVIFFQVLHFQKKFVEYQAPNGNPSLLYNQLAVVDWVYSKSPHLGFKVYDYVNTFHDYPYQYLFYWYGLSKYQYLPEEYANYPLSPKEIYVPGYQKYIEPKRSGERVSFLIIESDTNGEDNRDWINKFREYFDLIESSEIGKIKVEKYERKNGAPNDPCIWWKRC